MQSEDYSTNWSPENNGDTINISNYIRILKRRKWAIFFIILISFFLGCYYLSKATPIYQASVKIQADPIQPNSNSQDQFIMNSMVFLFYETQYEIIQSRSVAESVVEKLNLVEKYKTSILENGDVEDESTFSKIKNTIKSLISAEEVKEETAPLTNTQIQIMLAKAIQSSLKVEGGTQSQIINIAYESDDPELAVNIVNAVADAYIEFGLESRFDQVQDTSEWLSEQLEELRTTVQISEEKLKTYRLSANLIDTEQQARISNSQMQSLNNELIRAQSELSQASELYTQVQQIEKENGDYRSLRPVITNNTVRDLVREESTLTRRVQELSERYGEKHPTMIAARSDLKSAEDNLVREVTKIVDGIEREYKLADVQVENIKGLINETTKELQSFQGDTFELTRLEREVENNRRIYESFVGRLAENDVSSDYDASNIRIIDKATVPEYPIKPRAFFIIVLSIFFGSAVGVCYAFFKEFLGNVFRTPEQLETELGISTLGITPLVSKKEGQPEMQYILDQRSTFSEAINTIRTGLIFSNINKPPKTILITSTSGSEGKTTLAINLAVAFSQLNKCLLIELDLRKPAVSKDLGLNATVGLSDLLTGNTESHVYHQVEGAPNLSVITCGTIPQNPMELISSERFENLLAGFKDRFDHIIIDSPPTLPVSDSLVLSQLVDTAVVAVKAEDTKHSMVKETVTRLQKVNAKIAGTVLTQASAKKMGYYGDHYYQEDYYGVKD
ncbi:polysaccharide biosynthesis tyrosine autokinase [Alteromonas sp. 5E99-2]|uniref:GumC family protein n=1 Tax=Alteromonas sp. 5E99-2 TaxID=2817683 RepID=UPI001A98FB33|nr:polysaccharide biosynthesis tyrosine autokinase [Alteromonas sp. 5E99-2]MBO1254236.1 polysaccharide biosynthesis tyrosine autokinase [Alteromonas sp. 5E99-2]